MTRIYSLAQADGYQSLVQVDSTGEISYEDSIAIRATSLCGVEFGAGFAPPKLTWGTPRKNKNSDVYAMLLPFLVFSEKALSVLAAHLHGSGQVLPVLAPVPGLSGFHVTKILEGAVDLNSSVFKVYPQATVYTHLVLREECVKGAEIFRLQEKPAMVFVSEIFKRSVEDAGLKGFSFDEEVELS